MDAELARGRRRLEQVGRWHAEHPLGAAPIVDIGGPAREQRADRQRRFMAVERQRRALQERVEAQMRAGAVSGRLRVVVAHRQLWFRDQVVAGLTAAGLEVLAVDDGADAAGFLVAEQPDLLLVESRLPTLTGVDVLEVARRFSPATSTAAQAAHPADFTGLAGAGARAVWARVVPPADVVQGLLVLVRAGTPSAGG